MHHAIEELGYEPGAEDYEYDGARQRELDEEQHAADLLNEQQTEENPR